MSARRKLCNARLTISARETHAESQLSCQQQPAEEKTLCSRAASLEMLLFADACMYANGFYALLLCASM